MSIRWRYMFSFATCHYRFMATKTVMHITVRQNKIAFHNLQRFFVMFFTYTVSLVTKYF